MNILRLILLGLLLLTGPALRADPPALSLPGSTDPLAEALPILQAKYVDFKALNYKQGDHLTDLITRSNGEISLSASETDSLLVPIITATLPDNIIYWRLASFTLPPGKSWPDIAAQLQQASGTAPGIILDLRSNTTPDDYEGAEQIMGFFAPQDTALAKYDAIGAGHEVGIPNHPVHLPMVVLTNKQTTGAAEALAAFLKTDGALVVGRETSGRAAVFAEEKLSCGQVLRYAVENISLADGTLLLGHPVTPDISPAVDDHTEKAALTLIKDNQILDVIQESAERHRMSEASLVQGQDPEWDEYLASLERRSVLLSLPVIHDVVLISALDSLKAIRLSQRPSPPAQATADSSPSVSTSVQ
jgi:peptidase S41-like protein